MSPGRDCEPEVPGVPGITAVSPPCFIAVSLSEPLFDEFELQNEKQTDIRMAPTAIKEFFFIDF